MSYVRCSCSLFFTAAHFSLGGRQHFSFSHRRYKIFMLFFQQKKNASFAFFLQRQLSVALFLVKLRRLVAYFLSLFLLRLSLSLPFHIVDMTTNVSLILQTTRIQKQFPLSVFVFIDSSCLCFTRRGWLCDSRQDNLELHLGCQIC